MVRKITSLPKLTQQGEYNMAMILVIAIIGLTIVGGILIDRVFDERKRRDEYTYNLTKDKIRYGKN